MLVFIVTLYVSLLGMFLLVAIKRWELRTGRVLGARMRPLVSRVSKVLHGWADGVLPGVVRITLKRFALFVRDVLRGGVARLVLWFEWKLETLLRSVRSRTTPIRHGGAPASSFLREVAEHKKMLMRQSRRDSGER